MLGVLFLMMDPLVMNAGMLVVSLLLPISRLAVFPGVIRVRWP